MEPTNHLLIVDDEPAVARILETIARKVGFEVLTIHDSDQFEKALGQISPTVVCLDIAMPGRDGAELLGVLAAQSYAGKVLVMSGSHPSYIQMSAAIGKARGLQIAGTLAKPFRMKEASDLLKGLLR